ncbi:MAG: hypothetical protein PHD83_04905 [Caldisericia bacterium]|nr:hypothetical protein [Caldisericia bacterium]
MDRKKTVAFRFFLYFGVFFLCSLFLVIPYLWIKLSVVRFLLQTWLGPKTPYVRPIPYYKGINLQYPFLAALTWFLPIQSKKHAFLWKQMALTLLGGICLLLIDCVVSGGEIISQTLTHPSDWLSFFVLFSLSLGPILYPLIVWFMLIFPHQKEVVNAPSKARSKR